MPNIVRAEQDRFQFEELLALLAGKQLERGSYTLDVGEDGTCKLSRVKKYWMQKNEIEQL